ncbi:MAG: radical SAM protein [Nitrospirota bacterium]
MRVLIISTNRENLPDPVAPLGAAYVAAAVKNAGYDVRLLDLQFVVDVQVALKDAVRMIKPHIVGLSIRNIDNVAFPHSISYLPELGSVVRTLKALGIKLIVPGGSAFTLMPVLLLRALDLNIGIVGEGEDSFPELIRRIAAGLPVNNLPGLAYSHGGEYRVNSPRKIPDLDNIAAPDRSLIENSLYMGEGGAGNIQTKRGCPFTCLYCTYPLVEGRKVRMRSPAAAAAEFESAVKDYGLRHIFIVDNVFNSPAEHAKEFCRELIKRDVDAGWSCYVSPGGVDEELAGLMLKAGCKGVEFGTDSAVDSVLAELKKGFTREEIISASRTCADAGLPFCHSLLLGSPGDTADTVAETLDVMDHIRPNAVIAMLGVRVFPGTELAKRAKSEGAIKDDPGLRPVFYFSPGLDMGRVSEILGSYGRERPNFIMPGIHLRMTDKIRNRLRSYGFTGPLWEYLRHG